MRYLVSAILAVVAASAIYVGTAGAVNNIIACDGDQVCLNVWYANQEAYLPDSGDTLDYKSFDGTTRCYNSTKYSGRGTSYEARRYSLYVRWCVKNYSQITWWGYGLQYTSGASCSLSSYDTPYIYGGGIGTSSIYVTSRAHFTCDVGVPYSPIHVHPDCWLNVRYGALGASAVQAKGCDWV